MKYFVNWVHIFLAGIRVLLKQIAILKRLIIFFACFSCYQCVFSQQDTSALYLRFPEVPPITLLKSDSGLITKEALRKNHPVILMYFSPECHHCQRQVEDILARMDDLKKVQIVLATYRPMEELIAFANKYKLQQHQNIQIGRDTKYFIQPFYRIKNLPYLALYDKKGKLITTFEGNVNVDRLIEELK
jgi:thioredoxin-related protein